MTYFVQLVQIQKEMKLCNKARVLIYSVYERGGDARRLA